MDLSKYLLDVQTGPQRPIEAKSWEFYHKTRYPERQYVIDRMYSYGVEISELPDGTFFLYHSFPGGLHDVLRLTNHHAFLSDANIYGVRMDGREYQYFHSHQDAYWALEYLYNIIEGGIL